MKFIAVLNKKQPLTSQLNALAHASLGLPHKYQLNGSEFSEFSDIDNNSVSKLTDAPFIILTAKNGNQLRNFHKQLIEQNLPCNVFFSNMINGGSVENQISTVKESSLDDLEYVAVISFGSNEELNDLTKKFSLYRNPTT